MTDSPYPAGEPGDDQAPDAAADPTPAELPAELDTGADVSPELDDAPDDDSAVSRQLVRDEESGKMVTRTTYPDGTTEDEPAPEPSA